MNVFSKVRINLFRKPIKTIVLFLIITSLGIVSVAAISLRTSIIIMEENIGDRMQPILSIYRNQRAFYAANPDLFSGSWDAMYDPNPWNQQSFIHPSHIRPIGAMDEVLHHNYTVTGPRTSIAGMTMYSFDIGVNYAVAGFEHWFSSGRPIGSPTMTYLFGVSSSSNSQVEVGIITLEQGRSFVDNDFLPTENETTIPVMISEELAFLNGLQVGSEFKIFRTVPIPNHQQAGIRQQNWFLEEYIYEKIVINAEIVGLFHVPEIDESTIAHLPTSHQNQRRLNRMEMMNFIYTPNWVIADFLYRNRESVINSWDESDYEIPMVIFNHQHYLFLEEPLAVSMFVLKNPRYLDDFIENASHLLPEYSEFRVLSNSFEELVPVMDTFLGIADFILLGTLLAAVIILILLIMLLTRERRREIGIYLALGEQKKKIIMQMLIEIIVISIVGLTVALGIGILISNELSETMLINELQVNRDDNQTRTGLAGVPEIDVFWSMGIPSVDMTIEEMMTSFDNSLSFNTVVIFYLSGLTVVTLATSVSVIYIVKMNPKKILLE